MRIKLILVSLLLSSCVSYDSNKNAEDNDVNSDNVDNSVTIGGGGDEQANLDQCASEFLWKPVCNDGNLCILFPISCPKFESVCVFKSSVSGEDESEIPVEEEPVVNGGDGFSQTTPTFKATDSDEAECGGIANEDEKGTVKWSFSEPGEHYTGHIIASTGSAQFEFLVENPGERNQPK